MLADLRSFARELELFELDTGKRHEMLRLVLAFIHLHRANLRGLTADEQAMDRGTAFMDTPHPPDAPLNQIAEIIADGTRSARIDGFGAKALGERLASISLQQAGCERIATTPLPYVYSLLIYRTTYLYCLLLPLALIGPAGWLTPIFDGIVAYVFLGLAEVTEDLYAPLWHHAQCAAARCHLPRGGNQPCSASGRGGARADEGEELLPQLSRPPSARDRGGSASRDHSFPRLREAPQIRGGCR